MSDARLGTTRTTGVLLLWLAAVSTGIAALIAATGGATLDLAGVPISMHSVTRPVVVALALGLLGVWALGTGARSDGDRFYLIVARGAPLLAAAFAITMTIATFAGGAHIAGGADSSGYLSEARLWRAAGFWHLDALKTATPISSELTPINRQYVFTPVGFQPAGEGATVPGYPPGLPIHFALATAIGGERAQFLVVPLATGALVIVAFLLGFRLGGSTTGLLSAASAGSSPMLLYQATQPMSDVVAAFWWTLAVLLLIDPSKRRLFGAGLAAAVACAVRPNLFAMAPILLLMAWWWRRWDRRAVLGLATFAAPIAAAASGFALLQTYLYGSASTTGYGEVGSLFSMAHVAPNLSRYPRWAIFTQSAILLAAVAAPIAIRRDWIAPEIDRVVAERVAWSGLLFFAFLQAFYLLYISFDDWVFFRFLLPALPWILVLQSTVIAAAIRRVPLSMRGVALILVAILIASWGVGRARGLGAFRLQDSEHRYLDVAGFARGLPPNAVFMSVQHSGSLAYYNSASVLRWDWLEAGEIDRVVAALSQNGRPVFAVLDDWEETRFRQRFIGTAVTERLGTPLFIAGGPPGITTRVYAVRGALTIAAGG